MNAFITVIKKDGQRYAANNLQLLKKGWGGDYQQTVLVFECSGVLTSFDVQDIASIDYGVVPAATVAV